MHWQDRKTKRKPETVETQSEFAEESGPDTTMTRFIPTNSHACQTMIRNHLLELPVAAHELVICQGSHVHRWAQNESRHLYWALVM